MRKKILLVVLFLFSVVVNNIQAQQTALVYNSDTTAAERIAAWKNISGILANNPENKTQIAEFLAQLMSECLGKRLTPRNTDIPILTDFLKTFPKEEAVLILYLWIQANTNPNNVNGRYDPPEVFMRRRSGDCTEVAWLAETILKELGIETKVFLAVFRIDHSFKIGLAAHAFTGLDFSENNEDKRYIIDNRNLFELPPNNSWKNIIWQTYSQESEVWRYRDVDTSLWRNVRRDSEDPQRYNRSKFIIFAFMPRDTAIKEFAGYDLSQYFDNTAQEILFFRDDFQQTITKQKETGEITNQEYDRVLNLWRSHENDGW
jgi:hypothetical protein